MRAMRSVLKRFSVNSKQAINGPVREAGFDDTAADDEVATLTAGRCRGEVNGQRDAILARDSPPVDSVQPWTVCTSTDQFDHL